MPKFFFGADLVFLDHILVAPLPHIFQAIFWSPLLMSSDNVSNVPIKYQENNSDWLIVLYTVYRGCGIDPRSG